jgi:hypothetical protein
MDVPKSTKVVWTINGYLLLCVLLVVIGLLAVELVSSLQRSGPYPRGVIVGESSNVVHDLGASAQHLEYDHPERIADSKYLLTSVYAMDKDLTREVLQAIQSSGDVSRNLIGARVNVLIFADDRTEARSLLEGMAYIKRVSLPQFVRGTNGNTESPIYDRDHILYEIALNDSNGDDRINDRDKSAFFVSDYSGENLRQITPDSIVVDRFWYTSDSSGIFFEELVEGPTETVYGVDYTLDERRLYFFDLRSNQLERFDLLQMAFDRLVDEYTSRGASPE